MQLVIVESPTKAKTINKFLGKKYVVKSSMGHLIDLPKSQLGVDPENDFQVKYITIRGKGKALAELRRFARKAEKIYLATDPDREGEAIAWHLLRDFKIDEAEPCRVVFNEITKTAVKKAFNNPRTLNYDLIDAQQARRVLDRLVGYKISPLLWEKVKRGLSAGRVQSAALNMICMRQEEIDSFVPREFWTIEADFLIAQSRLVRAKLSRIDGAKPELSSAEAALKVAERVKNTAFILSKVESKDRIKNPQPPFITSTLQQQAGRKLNFSARKTMSVAQQLYEGISLGKRGTTGLLTYMRTDSVRISEDFQKATQEFIGGHFGKEYVPGRPPQYTSRKGAQDAHEAIRPTDVTLIPEEIRSYLSPDQYALYQLVWQRYVMSQMNPARYKQQTATFSGGNIIFKASHLRLIFPGFLKAGAEPEKEAEGADFEAIRAGAEAVIKDVFPEQHFTQAPPAYSEALLIKDMELKGIGRPSTYAPTIDTLLQRGYVDKENSKLQPTELGCTVNELLGRFFPDILDLDFTAELEHQLDIIGDGKLEWKKVVGDFYRKFKKDVEIAEKEMDIVTVADEVSDEVCENCGRNLVIKAGRYGKFLACPGYPECKNTKPLLRRINVQCPKCGGDIVHLRSRKGRWFYGCTNYPDCDFRSWKQPVAEKCPLCASLLVVQKKDTLGCSNTACPYTREREQANE